MCNYLCSPPQKSLLLEDQVDQETLGDQVSLFSLLDLQALVALVYLQSHILPAEQHT